MRNMRKLERARPRVVARVVAGVAQRQTAAAGARRVVAWRAMHDHRVEDETVARHHLPRFDVVLRAIGIDVGDSGNGLHIIGYAIPINTALAVATRIVDDNS